ncbi:CPXCG motif-containing cysteine-rich protein [Antarcticibacterium flavum]|uniref:CPXCG motif-containing cysteine-rich protein n=1 Tax=Antarcticibacterium flavum TaxID=2058175 RepID=A0A5B7X3R3_9FLAO|nr:MULTISPECIES: CPXCG motif-containing cysteine-rich protein [Antarcticibacterium]MCM4158426.1 CPXCG motif-containing cysteine-rich protein [Antarcticibacterium sp. W02-3]QCY70184.1 CPXCG motif-containing cysteine-rich protein [Antarcticibacterium flavum]
MHEYFFQCPYCWEEISVLLDPSVGSQSYVEDCEVCCNPIQISVSFEDNDISSFAANSIEQ